MHHSVAVNDSVSNYIERMEKKEWESHSKEFVTNGRD
jgi:hypothetical protein